MTREDFVLIADTIKGANLSVAQTSSLATLLASRLASTNPNFNRDRFIKRCMEEG